MFPCVSRCRLSVLALSLLIAVPACGDDPKEEPANNGDNNGNNGQNNGNNNGNNGNNGANNGAGNNGVNNGANNGGPDVTTPDGASSDDCNCSTPARPAPVAPWFILALGAVGVLFRLR